MRVYEIMIKEIINWYTSFNGIHIDYEFNKFYTKLICKYIPVKKNVLLYVFNGMIKHNCINDNQIIKKLLTNKKILKSMNEIKKQNKKIKILLDSKSVRNIKMELRIKLNEYDINSFDNYNIDIYFTENFNYQWRNIDKLRNIHTDILYTLNTFNERYNFQNGKRLQYSLDDEIKMNTYSNIKISNMYVIIHPKLINETFIINLCNFGITHITLLKDYSIKTTKIVDRLKLMGFSVGYQLNIGWYMLKSTECNTITNLRNKEIFMINNLYKYYVIDYIHIKFVDKHNKKYKNMTHYNLTWKSNDKYINDCIQNLYRLTSKYTKINLLNSFDKTNITKNKKINNIKNTNNQYKIKNAKFEKCKYVEYFISIENNIDKHISSFARIILPHKYIVNDAYGIIRNIEYSSVKHLSYLIEQCENIIFKHELKGIIITDNNINYELLINKNYIKDGNYYKKNFDTFYTVIDFILSIIFIIILIILIIVSNLYNW